MQGHLDYQRPIVACPRGGPKRPANSGSDLTPRLARVTPIAVGSSCWARRRLTVTAPTRRSSGPDTKFSIRLLSSPPLTGLRGDTTSPGGDR